MPTSAAPPDRPPLSLDQRLMRLITGGWIAQAISVAARLRIADRLVEGPRTVDELARAVEVHAPALRRLLRALASVEIFFEDEAGRFANTPFSERLVSTAPGSLQATAQMLGEEHAQAWGQLLYSVTTGETAFNRVYGMPVFEFFDANHEAAETFQRAMTEQARRSHLAAVEAYDFSRFRRVMDVGCGHGELLAAILAAHPALHGILFDRPSVVRQARAAMAARGLAGRCESVAGSFFESVPPGADACVMSSVIHDWDDAQSVAILSNVRAALPPDGTLLLIERVLAGRNEPDLGKLADLNMLVMTGGLERTADEFRNLLERAGFRLEQVVTTRSSSCVIEARRR